MEENLIDELDLLEINEQTENPVYDETLVVDSESLLVLQNINNSVNATNTILVIIFVTALAISIYRLLYKFMYTFI